MPTNADLPTKKQSNKKDVIKTYRAGSIKVVFTLLTKDVTLYMRLFIVEIREPSFQLAFSIACGF